ncbi:MAG: SLOG family protein [Bacilli bacterium]|nr:SLOG family protein [Bacilli bacterium]
MKIAVTGHRPNKLWGYNYDQPNYKKLKDIFKRILKENNCTEAITGMALGVDQVFAQAVIELKDEGMNISLTCAIPCFNQSSIWPNSSKEIYNSILDRADNIIIITESNYTKSCMQKRNEWMVDRCDLLIGVWNGSSGGTSNCIQYSIIKNKTKYIIDPSTLVQDKKLR